MTIYTIDSRGVQNTQSLLVEDFSPPSGNYFVVYVDKYVVWHNATNYNRHSMVTVGGQEFCGTIKVAQLNDDGYFTEFEWEKT